MINNEYIDEVLTNYAICKQVDKIEFIATSCGDICFNEEELEKLKSFLIELLELRLQGDNNGRKQN